MAEIVLALDLPDRDAALRLLDQLPTLRWVKVGSQLMTAEGPALVAELAARGLDVFLDLKWHDIPHTVAGAVAAARRLGVRMATVHTLGGPAMLRAAAAAGDGLRLVGVTVLTSHGPTEWQAVVGVDGRDLGAEAERLAREAMAAGLAGLVCSPREIERLRRVAGPGGVLVVPGIRRPGDPAGDQVRASGPAEAAAAGATHLVVGRPIVQAEDPAAVLDEFLIAARS